MKVAIHSLAGEREVLAGAQAGAALFTRLVAARLDASEPTPVFLDCHGVDVATSSFLRESLLAFRDYCRGRASNLYPVAANLSADVEEELHTLLEQRGDAFVVCDLAVDDTPMRPRVIGVLEEKQQEALFLVIQANKTDAPTLARDSDSKVGPTAWNNRLSALARKSLLMCRQTGRLVQFSPVLRGMSYGS